MNRRVRVLRVCNNLKRTGGVAKLVVTDLNHLELAKFETHLVAEPGGDYRGELAGKCAQIHDCPAPFPNIPGYIRRLSGILREYGPFDVVHAEVNAANGWVMWLAQRANVPVRITQSHLDVRLLRQRGRVWWRLAHATSARLIRRYATSRLAVSKAAATMYAIGGEVEPGWHFVPNSIDLRPFTEGPSRINLRSELGLPDNAFVIGHVGRFFAQKNHEFLIGVAAEAMRRDPDVWLLLVGDGPLYRPIKEKVELSGISGRVVFAGVRNDIPQLMLQAMDVIVLPSLFEGLPVVLVEAQAAGLPCVISNTVSEDADIVNSLVRRVDLAEPSNVWANHLLHVRRSETRMDPATTMKILKQGGFELSNRIRLLESFYAGAEQGMDGTLNAA